MSPNDADGMANRVDPDQQSDLGLHCLPGMSVRKLRIIKVLTQVTRGLTQ